MDMFNKSISKGVLALALSAALCLIASIFSYNAYAGGGYVMPQLKGVNTDGTVNPGATVKMYDADLEAASPGITSDSDIAFYFEIRTTNDFSEAPTRVDAKHSTSEGGYYFLKIDRNEYCNKYIMFCSHHPSDSGLNNNGNLHKTLPNQLHLSAGPEIIGVQYKGGLLSKDVVVNVSSTSARYCTDINPEWRYEDKRTIKLYSNGSLVGTQTNSSYGGYSTTFSNVPVKYGADTPIKVEVHLSLEGTDIPPISKSYTIPGEALGTPSADATKINNKQVALSWSPVQGATGYEIYKGAKKIKTVGNVSKYTVKGKGAAKAKYKVVALLSEGGQTHRGNASGAVKPKKNELKFSRSLNYGSTQYATCPFRITKISLKGSTYTVTGYAVNNRIFKMKKYKSLRVGLYVGGKKVFLKKYKSKTVNCRARGSKKIVLKIKGKKGVDLRNGGNVSYVESGAPVW